MTCPPGCWKGRGDGEPDEARDEDDEGGGAGPRPGTTFPGVLRAVPGCPVNATAALPYGAAQPGTLMVGSKAGVMRYAGLSWAYNAAAYNFAVFLSAVESVAVWVE